MRGRCSPRGVEASLRTALALALWLVLPASAQVVRDGSIGPGAGVQPVGPGYVIDETMGALSDRTLFHSFSRFDLSALESATFTSISPVDNVLARITGGASFIDGSVISTVAGANLFLVNPSGIVFGPNASVSVDGAFHASAARRVLFDNGASFETSIQAGAPAVVAAAPESFGFSGNRASIRINGASIAVNDGHTLSLSGAGIELTGAALQAREGQVRLIASIGQERVPVAGSVQPLGSPGDISIDSGSSVDVSGDPAGQVLIRGRTVQIRNAQIEASTEGAAAAVGAVIDIQASDAVRISGSSELSATAEGAGQGGNIQVAAGLIELSQDAEILSDAESSGDAGAIRLDASHITLSDDAEIASDVETGASGNGGQVSIATSTLELFDSSEVSSDTDPGSTGNGGQIVIRASASVRLQLEPEPGEQAGILSNSEGSGDAGDVRIRTPDLDLQGGSISAGTQSIGAGGNVDIDVSRVTVANGASISALSSGAGNAGNVRIVGGHRVSVLNGGSITTESAVSNGGNITIGVPNASPDGFDLVTIRRGRVSADVNDGTGGNITINARNVVVDDAEVVARAGAGRGGEIVINGDAYFADRATISASAGPAGIAGSVEINAPEIDVSGDLDALVAEYLDAAAILRAQCAARRGGTQASSFTVDSPRGVASTEEGLPVNVDGAVASNGSGAAASRSLVLSARARDAVRSRQPGKAAQLLDAARDALNTGTRSADRIYAQIHLASSHARAASLDSSSRRSHLLSAHGLLVDAVARAEALGDQRALSFANGNLGTLYASRSRHREARYLFARALRAAETAREPQAAYRWYWHAGRSLWAQGETALALTSFQRAVTVLDATRPSARMGRQMSAEASRFFQDSITPVYRNLIDALLSSAGDGADAEQRLVDALDVLERFRAAELRNYFDDDCVAEVSEENVARGVAERSVAVLHPVVLEDRVELLMSVAGDIERHRIEVSASELAFRAASLRRWLERPKSPGHLRAARQLHDWLIAPIAPELSRRGIETLVLVPDGPLRTIPFAALHDGARYLVERYALAIAPGLSMVDLRPIESLELRALAAGLTGSVAGYRALPAVGAEIRNVASRLDGEVLLDADFRLERLRSALIERQPSVVHIASHAQFSDDLDDSFILTSDGRLGIDALERYVSAGRTGEFPLELLVLSACETASGDERAALGLAGIAVRAGARSALGSLWSISDDAASTMVREFYRGLTEPGASRASALRGAQLALLEDGRFRHPYYWSPFLLINNWR